MRFGTKTEIKIENGITTSKTTKFRDYNEIVNETICEERKQIMKIQDFDTLVAQMHIDHALQDHGAWIEYRGDKMYAVLSWIEKH